MIASGTAITFDVQGTTGPYLPRTVAAVRRIVVDELTPFFDVMDVSISTSSVLSDPAHALSDWPYRATVQAIVRADYNTIRDVDSIVAHAFAEGAGEVPTVTANVGSDGSQGEADQRAGLSVGMAGLLLVAGLVAVAVIKAE